MGTCAVLLLEIIVSGDRDGPVSRSMVSLLVGVSKGWAELVSRDVGS